MVTNQGLEFRKEISASIIMLMIRFYVRLEIHL